MQLINNQLALNRICELLAHEPVISIDTEFERKYHYFANLSTIQIVTKNYKLIIDYLSPINIAPLKNIILNDNILKIFHSPRQDLEIFYKLFSKIPQNIFDTQLAANICEYGDCISYSNLCDMVLSQKIDKQYQNADWMRRPIEPYLLEYAINDAEYLIPLYEILNGIILDKNLQKKYQARLLDIISTKNYQINCADAWKKVRFHKPSAKFLIKMQAIAGYREECASIANIPRRHFASDEDLVKLCYTLPVTGHELNRLELDKYYFNKSQYREKLLQICAKLKA